MTPEEFIAKFPEAMRALCEGRAAVMPIMTNKIVYGAGEFCGEKIDQVPVTVSRNLFHRLDKLDAK